MKTFNYKLKIEIFRNSTQKYLGVLRGSFQGFGCPKRHPDGLLAKTMIGTNSVPYHFVLRGIHPFSHFMFLNIVILYLQTTLYNNNIFLVAEI